MPMKIATAIASVLLCAILLNIKLLPERVKFTPNRSINYNGLLLDLAHETESKPSGEKFLHIVIEPKTNEKVKFLLRVTWLHQNGVVFSIDNGWLEQDIQKDEIRAFAFPYPMLASDYMLSVIEI
ncbi:MAG: hypothetical protein CMN81_16375 [Spongiibacter sp.]|nr:hypothetical protein [Spongiibacter sp.]MBU73672.1 hypothetical protein [Spongiibacter sp.]|tara:strand:- start:12087 stop:12461 length:375 start_codon:yes stop_codon:yes gene_type:complete